MATSPAGYFTANIFHAGVLEDASAFARGLSQKLGRPVDFPATNGAPERIERAAGADARARIEALYPRDFELYEHQRSDVSGARASSAA